MKPRDVRKAEWGRIESALHCVQTQRSRVDEAQELEARWFQKFEHADPVTYVCLQHDAARKKKNDESSSSASEVPDVTEHIHDDLFQEREKVIRKPMITESDKMMFSHELKLKAVRPPWHFPEYMHVDQNDGRFKPTLTKKAGRFDKMYPHRLAPKSDVKPDVVAPWRQEGGAVVLKPKPSAKPQVCKWYSRKGCWYGRNCRFLHVEKPKWVPKQSASSTDPVFSPDGDEDMTPILEENDDHADVEMKDKNDFEVQESPDHWVPGPVSDTESEKSAGERNTVHSSLTMVLPDSAADAPVDDGEVKSPQVAGPADEGEEEDKSRPLGNWPKWPEHWPDTPTAAWVEGDGVKTPDADYPGSEGDALEPVKAEVAQSGVKIEVDVGVSASYSSSEAVYPPWCESEGEIAKPKSKPKSKLPDVFEGEC